MLINYYCQELRTAAGEDIGVGGVNHDGPDVVRVSLKRVDLLKRVVVEHTHQHVVLGGGDYIIIMSS